MTRRVLASLVTPFLLFVFAAGLRAQAPPPSAGSDVHVAEVAHGFYLISNAHANLLLVVSADSSFVVGVQSPDLVAKALETLQDIHAPAVKYALAIDDEQATDFLDGGWGQRGAITFAQESLYGRMWKAIANDNGHTPPGLALPSIGFSAVVQLHLKGEDAHLMHQRDDYTDGDAFIHFESSGVLYLGPVFTSDGYPRIDADRGGDLTGMITTVTFYVTNFGAAAEDIEPIIPGRGPAATVADLRAYGDMLRAVQARVQALVKDGKSLADVQAAKPTAAFDARWGHGPVTPDAFVAMVYAAVSARQR
jgi:hypothetical protein